MRYPALAAALLLAACQTGQNADLVAAGFADASNPLPLAEEPRCYSDRTEGKSLVNAWCQLEMAWDGSGRVDPCWSLVGAEGSQCRVGEVRAYLDPVNNPLEGDFTS